MNSIPWIQIGAMVAISLAVTIAIFVLLVVSDRLKHDRDRSKPD